MTREEIETTIQSLVERGLVRDSGRRRNGQIVWVITELGKVYGKDIIDAAHETKH
jgi:chromosome segregation and condensation protein ScpB